MRYIDLALGVPPRDLYRLIRRRLTRREPLTGFDGFHPCVFVLSTGRVGSMTLAQILSRQPHLVALHEPNPHLFGISKVAYQQSFAGPEEIWDQVFWSLRGDLLTSAMSEGRGFVETSPQGTFLAPVIARTVPEAKFVHLVRHPADVIRSGMRRNWYGGISSDSSRIVPRSGSRCEEHWDRMCRFEKIAWLWNETNRWILEFLETIPSRRSITIRAEDLFSGNCQAFEKLWTICGASETGNQNGKDHRTRALNVQVAGEFPESHSWSEEMREIVRDTAGEVSQALGYAT